MSNFSSNVKNVINNELCCGCGTCSSICPVEAITLRLDEDKGIFVPIIDEEKCVSCQICFFACPGHSVDFASLNIDIFGKKPKDIQIGNYLSCYLSQATNNDIRYNGSSGGFATAILIAALECGMIDGALVTRMRKDRPFEPEPFIARTKNEIIEASKSKYCPVPANLALKEIINSKDGERFAMVGLPCHIHGVRKYANINKKFKEKMVLCIGLICSHNDTFHQTNFLLDKFKIKRSDVIKIDYRGEGWPGKMSIFLKNGRNVSIPYHESIGPHVLWINAMHRCLFCCDLTAELADISCGDPWIPEIMDNEHFGKSIIISRSMIGEEICLFASEKHFLELNNLDIKYIKLSTSNAEAKKRDLTVRFGIRRLLKKNIPIYNSKLLNPGVRNYMRSVFIYFNTCLFNEKYLCGICPYVYLLEMVILKIFSRGRK